MFTVRTRADEACLNGHTRGNRRHRGFTLLVRFRRSCGSALSMNENLKRSLPHGSNRRGSGRRQRTTAKETTTPSRSTAGKEEAGAACVILKKISFVVWQQVTWSCAYLLVTSPSRQWRRRPGRQGRRGRHHPYHGACCSSPSSHLWARSHSLLGEASLSGLGRTGAVLASSDKSLVPKNHTDPPHAQWKRCGYLNAYDSLHAVDHPCC